METTYKDIFDTPTRDYDPDEMVPAITPEDYSGSQADWMVGLQQYGLWNGKGWHGDVMIRLGDYSRLLSECEDDDQDDA